MAVSLLIVAIALLVIVIAELNILHRQLSSWLNHIANALTLLARILADIDVKSFRISQLQGRYHMAVTGVKPGASGTFVATTVPPGSVLPAGVIPKWSVDNSAVTLVDAADGLSTVASVAANTAPGSFNLTVQALVNGSDAIGTVSVPILAVVVDVTGFTIDQTA